MNKCVICNKEIKNDSQYINGNWYHNDCIENLNNTINELEKWLEEEQDRLAKECSHIYEDSLGKTRLVNEDIFNEITKTKDKLKELKGE